LLEPEQNIAVAICSGCCWTYILCTQECT